LFENFGSYTAILLYLSTVTILSLKPLNLQRRNYVRAF
jgi:hypothetical protein